MQRLSQWSYGPVNKNIYNIIGLDYRYPPHYYDHVIFASDVKKAKKTGSIMQKEDVLVVISRHNAATKRAWTEYYANLEDARESRKVNFKPADDEVKLSAVVQTRDFQFHVPTAIQIIAENKRDDLINNSCLKHYVEQKWKHWGAKMLRKKFLWTAFSFGIFMGFIISRAAYMMAFKGSVAETNTRDIALAFYFVLLALEIRNMWIELCLYRVYTCNYSNYFSKLHGTARAYTIVTVLFQLSIVAGAIATGFGNELAENISFAASSFLETCSLLWCLLGDESIGKLIMSIIEIISCDLYSYTVVYTLTISGFTAAFYLLSPQISLVGIGNAYENDSQPVLLFIQRYCEMLFNGFTPGTLLYASFAAPDIQWYAELLCFLFLFTVPILMLNLLIAIMNDRYSEVQKSISTRWLLEMCNIMSRFEMEIVAMNDVHKMNTSPYLTRIENLVEEFKLFTITVGADAFSKYIEIETIDNNWNTKNTPSESKEDDEERGDDDVFDMHDTKLKPIKSMPIDTKATITELKRLLVKLENSL